MAKRVCSRCVKLEAFVESLRAEAQAMIKRMLEAGLIGNTCDLCNSPFDAGGSWSRIVDGKWTMLCLDCALGYDSRESD